MEKEGSAPGGRAFAAVLLLALFALGFCCLLTGLFNGGALQDELTALKEGEQSLREFLDVGAERGVNGDLDESHIFIEFYGGAQRLLGHRVVQDMVAGNSVVRLANGNLNFVTQDEQKALVQENAEKTVDFLRAVSTQGFPVRFLLLPYKIDSGSEESELPVGMTDYINRQGDAFLAVLRQAGENPWDLREDFRGREDYAQLFFRTDHHWKPEAGREVAERIARQLHCDYDLPLTEEVFRPENWETEVLPAFFLGSQGKRVGTLFAAPDDFSLLRPKFPTDLRYSCQDWKFEREGPFAESVCFPEQVEKRDYFDGNPYTYYAGGDYPLAVMENRNYPTGPNLVLIRDSYSCVVAPFLALSCHTLTTIDLRFFEGDLIERLRQLQPDVLLIAYGASSVNAEALFAFLGKEGS